MVSLVINERVDGKIRISKATQQRVWESVRRLGYMPNVAARRLAGGSSRLLGVFTFEPIFPMETTNFYFPMLVGIEEGAEIRNYNLVLFTGSAQSDGRRHIYSDGMNALGLADGAILLGSREDRGELLRLHESGYPFVYVGRREVEGRHLPSIGADYHAASVEIMQVLFRHGHRTIAHLDSVIRNESALDRERGVRKAYSDMGLCFPDTFNVHLPPEDVDIQRLRTWVDTGVTAVVVEQMPTAIRLKELAMTMDLKVPGDLSIAALGNSGDPAYDLFGITTFLIPRREMGAQAVAKLVDKLEGRESDAPETVLLPCTIFEGTTVGAPRGVPNLSD